MRFRFRTRLDPAAVLGVTLCVISFLAMRGDISPLNHYLGDDGKDYVEFIKKFPLDQTVSSYAISRVGVIWLIRFLLTSFHIPLEAPEIVRAFQYVNTIAVAIAVLAYVATMRHLRVSLVGRIVGIVLAFGAFSVSKWPYFYPNMTDTVALMLGSLYAYFYVRNKPVGILVVLGLSLFSWPYLLALIGLALLAMRPREPRVFVEAETKQDFEDPPLTREGWVVTALVGTVLLFLLVASVALREKQRLWILGDSTTDPFERYHHYDPVYAPKLLPITLVITFLCGVYPIATLLRGLSWRTVLAELRVGWLVVGFGAIRYAQWQQMEWANVRTWTEPPFRKLLIQFALTVQRPAQAIVGHLAFFGVATVLLIFYFRPFARVVRQLGSGYVAVVCLSLLLLLTSESRQEGPVLFLILPVLAKAIDERGIRLPIFVFASACAILTSKVWFDVRSVEPTVFKGATLFLEFPLQYYFMHHGIAMGKMAFLFHGLALAAMLLVGFATVRRWSPR